MAGTAWETMYRSRKYNVTMHPASPSGLKEGLNGEP